MIYVDEAEKAMNLDVVIAMAYYRGGGRQATTPCHHRRHQDGD